MKIMSPSPMAVLKPFTPTGLNSSMPIVSVTIKLPTTKPPTNFEGPLPFMRSDYVSCNKFYRDIDKRIPWPQGVLPNNLKLGVPL